MKNYQSKNKYINDYLKEFQIEIIEDKEKRKVNSPNIHYLSNINYNAVKNIIASYINRHNFGSILFTNMREDLKENIYISKTLNICFSNLPIPDKLTLIMHHFYRTKDAIKKVGLEKALFYYRRFNWYESVSWMAKHAYNCIEEYLYIGSLKTLIKTYQKEVDPSIDILNPILTDSMIFKYLDNYFSKLIIISYNEEVVKNFLFDYYKTEAQAEDNINEFLRDIIFTYQTITNKSFDYKNQYQYKLGYYERFHHIPNRVKNFKKLHIKLDTLIANEENYNKLLFMYELLEVHDYKSEMKKIVNYITAIELMLTHSPKSNEDTISSQFIQKSLWCLDKIKKKDFSKKELKLIYTYRSKIIHGDRKALSKIIRSLSKMPEYVLNQKQLKEEIYLYQDQLIESILEKRTEKLFKLIFTLFIKDYPYINELKELVMTSKKESELVII